MNAYSTQSNTRLFILCLRICTIRFGILFFKKRYNKQWSAKSAGGVVERPDHHCGDDLGYMGFGNCANRKHTFQYKVFLYVRGAAKISDKLHCARLRHTVWAEGRVAPGSRRCTSRNVDLCWVYAHYRSILQRLAIIHNAADRQTDRQSDSLMLCYGNGIHHSQLSQTKAKLNLQLQ